MYLKHYLINFNNKIMNNLILSIQHELIVNIIIELETLDVYNFFVTYNELLHIYLKKRLYPLTPLKVSSSYLFIYIKFNINYNPLDLLTSSRYSTISVCPL